MIPSQLRAKIVAGLIASILPLADLLSAMAEEKVQSAYGSFTIPDEFSFQRSGTVDSLKGEIKRKIDGFVVHFDLGFMAGTHMHSKLQSLCSYFREHTINGISAKSGIQSKDTDKMITTTIDDPKSGAAPANFWATVKSDADLADFFVIVSTYKSATGVAEKKAITP
jgi:hypothetical protein